MNVSTVIPELATGASMVETADLLDGRFEHRNQLLRCLIRNATTALCRSGQPTTATTSSCSIPSWPLPSSALVERLQRRGDVQLSQPRRGA